ncbi:unnamed protein product, partial [Clonostachys rhizophaga]
MDLPLQTLESYAQRNAEGISASLKFMGKFFAHFFKREKSEERPETSQAGFSEPPGPSVGIPSSASKFTPRKRSHRGANESAHKRICSETAVFESRLPESQAPASPASGSTRTFLPPSASEMQKQKTKVCKSKVTQKLAKEYDNDRCVVTGLGNPQGCHLIPFMWNSTMEHLHTAGTLTGVISMLFGVHDMAALTLLHSCLGASDKIWNMICLSPQLHTWWRKAYFGLKYLRHEDNKETSMSTAELQFVWMPHSQYGKSTKRIDLNEEEDKASNLRACHEHMFGGETPCSPKCDRCTAISKVQAHKVREHFTIESGYFFPVVRPTEDIEYFKAMIQLQWAAICVGSMSGAANYPELL